MIKRTLLSLSLIVTTLGFLNSSQAELVQVKESKNLSQLVRSNASDYWEWAKQQQESQSTDSVLTPWLQHTGVVMGDPHIGNFSVRQTVLVNGDTQLVYRPVDFDDVGRAPFVVDLAKLAVATLAVNPKFKIKSFVGAYVKGLKNQSTPEIPPRVQQALGLNSKQVLKMDSKEIGDHVKGNALELKKNKLEEINDPTFETMTQTLYPKAKVLSVARRVLDRGGSVDALRVWVLIGSAGDRKIIEFKELLESSVSAYGAQQTIAEMIQPIFINFMPFAAAQEFVLINYGERTFWVREKRATLVDTKFNVSKSEEKREFKVLSKLAAFNLGLIHGRQPEAEALKSEIEEQGEKSLKEAVHSLSKPYVDSITSEHPQFK